MLMWGVFSTRTPAGRRYVRQCGIALTILILPSLFFLIHQYSHFHYFDARTFGRATAILLTDCFFAYRLGVSEVSLISGRTRPPPAGRGDGLDLPDRFYPDGDPLHDLA